MAIPRRRNTSDLTDPLASSQELHEASRGAQEPRAPPASTPSPNAAATRRRSSSLTALHRPTARIRALVSLYRPPHTFCASFHGRSSHQNHPSTALRRGTPPAPLLTPPRALPGLANASGGLRMVRRPFWTQVLVCLAPRTPDLRKSGEVRPHAAAETHPRRPSAAACAPNHPEPPDLEATALIRSSTHQT